MQFGSNFLFLILGIALMVFGAVLYVVVRKKTVAVVASNGSVAVGKNNSGTIQNVKVDAKEEAAESGNSHRALTILAITVELVGIGVTIWHAVHLATK